MRFALLILLISVPELLIQGQDATSRLSRIGAQPGGHQLHMVSQTGGWVYGTEALWRTESGGATWTRVLFPLPKGPAKPGVPPPTLISIDFESLERGWISVENSKDFPKIVEERSVFRTKDGGRTWQEQPPSPLAEKGAQYSQFYLNDGAIGWEGGEEPTAGSPVHSKPPTCKPWWDGRPVEPAIFHTVDNGTTWVEQHLPSSHGCKVDLLFFKNSQDGIAVAEHDVYYTQDGGATWRQSEFLACCTDSDWHSVFSMPPADLFFVEATGWLSYEDGYLFKTLDGGKSWREIAHPGQIWHRQAGPGDFGTLFFTSQQRGWILGGDHAIYETGDGGATWSRLRSAAPINSISCTGGLCWALSEKELYRINTK